VLVSSILRWYSGQGLHVSLDISLHTGTPKLLVRDVKIMFGKGGGVYGVVRGKDGYDTGDRARL